MGNFSYQALARLKDGVTIEQANADIDRLIPMAVEKFPGGMELSMLEQAKFAANLRPLKHDAVGDVGKVLWVLLGTVGLVLLIACANVANLFLVRAEERRLEVALRTALGASRGRLAKDLLTESVTLALLAGLVGLGLAWAGIRLLVRLGPSEVPRLEEVSIDPTVLSFTLAVSALGRAALRSRAARPGRWTPPGGGAERRRTRPGRQGTASSARPARRLASRARPGAPGRLRVDDSQLPGPAPGPIRDSSARKRSRQ